MALILSIAFVSSVCLLCLALTLTRMCSIVRHVTGEFGLGLSISAMGIHLLETVRTDRGDRCVIHFHAHVCPCGSALASESYSAFSLSIAVAQ